MTQSEYLRLVADQLEKNNILISEVSADPRYYCKPMFSFEDDKIYPGSFEMDSSLTIEFRFKKTNKEASDIVYGIGEILA